MPEEISDGDFVEKTARGTCLVLFYKDPCPFCRTMKGVVEKFGKKHPDVRIFQINGPLNPKSVDEAGVERFPELLFYKEGKATEARQKGLTNPQGLTALFRAIGG